MLLSSLSLNQALIILGIFSWICNVALSIEFLSYISTISYPKTKSRSLNYEVLMWMIIVDMILLPLQLLFTNVSPDTYFSTGLVYILTFRLFPMITTFIAFITVLKSCNIVNDNSDLGGVLLYFIGYIGVFMNRDISEAWGYLDMQMYLGFLGILNSIIVLSLFHLMFIKKATGVEGALAVFSLLNLVAGLGELPNTSGTIISITRSGYFLQGILVTVILFSGYLRHVEMNDVENGNVKMSDVENGDVEMSDVENGNVKMNDVENGNVKSDIIKKMTGNNKYEAFLLNGKNRKRVFQYILDHFHLTGTLPKDYKLEEKDEQSKKDEIKRVYEKLSSFSTDISGYVLLDVIGENEDIFAQLGDCELADDIRQDKYWIFRRPTDAGPYSTTKQIQYLSFAKESNTNPIGVMNQNQMMNVNDENYPNS